MNMGPLEGIAAGASHSVRHRITKFSNGIGSRTVGNEILQVPVINNPDHGL